MAEIRVIKRDFSLCEFDKKKVEASIKKAIEASGEELTSSQKKKLRNYIKLMPDNLIFDEDHETSDEEIIQVSVDQIQNAVEEWLMSNGFHQTVRAYILYREQRNTVRNWVDGKVEFINKYKASDNTANATIDDNSNASGKNVGVLNNESHKEDNINISRGIITRKLRELYPEFDSKQYVRDLESHIIYKHDESSFSNPVPYCTSITMYPFLIDGIKKLGGLSASPKNLDSFCGIFVNMVHAISGQFAGACMSAGQEIIIKEGNRVDKVRSKDLVDKYFAFLPIKTFANEQGTWEYVEPENLFVLEASKFVGITKLYRRKYSDKLYRITSYSGHSAEVSKDHRFKQLYKGRFFEVKASDLQVNDTVEMDKDYSTIVSFESEDWKLGWILGMICGDGSISSEEEGNEVRLAVNYKQEYLGTTFNQYLKEIFGVELVKYDGHKCFDYRKSDKSLATSLRSLIIGTTCYDKHIDLDGKSIDFKLGFLDGIFSADGSYSRGHGFSISLTNYDLSKNIHDICGELDLTTNITTIKARGPRKESYQQYISSKILKYILHSKKKILVKAGLDPKELRDISREVYYYGKNSNNSTNATNTRYLWSNSKNPEKQKTDVIKSIELIDNYDDYVYELETESHWYNCGGFITHNCATSEFLLYFTFFAKKEWGDDFYLHPDREITQNTNRPLTIGKQIEQYFQQIVYTINQPIGARGSTLWPLSH